MCALEPSWRTIVGAAMFATARPQFGDEAPVASWSWRMIPFETLTAWSVPLAATAYTISSPDGDQLGDDSTTALLVSCWRLPPSASMTKISSFATNAIRVPSGDHDGSLSVAPVVPSF